MGESGETKVNGEKKEQILEAVCDICHWPYVYRDDEVMHAEKCDHCTVEAILNGIDTDVRPVVYGHNEDGPSMFTCSVCKWSCFDTVPGDTEEYNFCPNCGADMRGDDNV